jgi:hypothetical protein
MLVPLAAVLAKRACSRRGAHGEWHWRLSSTFDLVFATELN